MRIEGRRSDQGCLPLADGLRWLVMSTPSVEELTDPEFVKDLRSLPIEEVRRRRGLCQDAEESSSLCRRLVQGRLDIVQAELLRRAGGGSAADVTQLVESLPGILGDRGDRHLGPGRLTSLGRDEADWGTDFDAFAARLDRIIDGTKLAELSERDEADVRNIADQLDALERDISGQRHQLHKHIDAFQEEIVRRYKSGEASVDALLDQ
jgi:hypothetical protein